MNRRALLVLVGGTSASLAGCASGEPPGSRSDPPVRQTSIETTGSDCATPDDDWAVARTSDSSLTIIGTTPAPHPCHAASIISVTGDLDRLTVEIGVESTLGPDEVCVTCAGAVGYEATIEVEDGPVEELTIAHRVGERHLVPVHEVGEDTIVTSVEVDTIRTEPGVSDAVDAIASGPIVSINGQRPAPDPCHNASIADTWMEGRTLHVRIGAERDSADDVACAQVISTVAYEAMVKVSGPKLPEKVVVEHLDAETHRLDVRRWGR